MLQNRQKTKIPVWGIHFSRILMTIALCFLIFGEAKADIEPGNNSPGTTTDVLPMGGSQTGTVSSGDNDDYYLLTSSADGNITISLSNDNNSYAYIYLYNADGVSQLGTTSGYAQGGISFTVNGLSAGNYYARVYGNTSQTYTFNASLVSPPQANDIEPNNTPATALSYTVNTNVTGHIAFFDNNGTYDNYDYYVFTTSSDGDITVTLTNDNNNYTYIYLYDNDGATQLGTTSGYAQSGISFAVNGLAAGTYYVMVYGGNGGYAGYTLNASLSANPYPNDGVFNEYFSTAPSFSQNDSIKGHIAYRNNGGSFDNNDFFSFYSNGDYDITITLKNNNNNYAYIYLYDTDTVTQLGTTSGYAQTGISFTVNGLAAGTYYIRVYAGNGGYAGYTLYNTYTANPIPNDAEPNNSPAQAVATSYNSVNTGHIAYRQIGGSYDNDDYYVFTTPSDGNLTFNLTNNNNNYTYIYLYDNDGTTQLGSTSGYAQTGITFTANGLAAGTYYARVYAGNGAYSGYTLSKTFSPTPYTNDVEPNNNTGTALTLNPNTTVTGHIAHRFNGGSFDNYDYYQLVTSVDGNISLNISNDNNAYLYIYLYDIDGTTQLGATSGYAQTGISFTVNGLAAGTYYALVYAGNGAYSGYTLSNILTPAMFNNDVEPNNSFATASVMNNNASKQGHIGYRFNGGAYDNYDYWKITMLQTDSMRIDISMANNNYSYVYLYNSAQNQIYSNSGYNLSYSIFYNSLPAGDYYLMVYAGNGSYNSYTVTNFYYPCNTDPSVITAAGPTTFCIPGSVTLNSANTYASYLWSNSSTTNSINVTTSGTFSLTAYDNDGCPHSSNSITTNAVSPPVAAITPGGSTTFCQGGSVALTASAGTSWQWSTGATTQSITANTSGNYVVTVTNAQGCSATSAGTAVTVNPLPVVTLSPFSAVCNTLPAFALSGGSPSGGTYSGTGVSSGQFDPAAAGVGTHIITYSYTDGNSCSAQASQPITVNNCSGICTASITPSGNTTFCDGGSVDLTASAGASYLWSTGATTQTITVSTTGTYTVSVTDAFNCTATASETVTVQSLSTAADSVTSNRPNNEICTGGNITLTANGGSLGDGAGWKWYSGSCGSTLVGTGTSVTVSPSATTTYYVRAEGTCNNTSCVSITVTVTAGALAQAVSMPFIGMPANACPGTTATLSIPAVANATQYIWDGPPGTTFDGNPSPYTSSSPSATIVFGTPNTSLYQIGIQAGNSCGNSLRKIQKIRYSVSVPAAVTGATTACANTSDTYSTTAVTGATSYLWTITGDATVSGTGTSVTVNFGPSWTGGTLCVAAQTSCYTSASKCLTIGASGTNFGVISGNFSVCPNTQEMYSVTPGTGIASYNWTVPAGASVISGQGSNSVTVDFGPSYNSIGNICVTATSICGVPSAPKCRTIVPGIASTPSSISGIMNGLCNATSVNYSTPIVSGITSYNWTVPSGATIVSGLGTNSINVNFGSLTTGQVCVSATNTCGTSATRCIPVKGAPNTPAGITANPATWCAGDAGINFTADVSNVTGGYTLSWAYPSSTSYVSGGGNSTSLTLDWGSSNGVVMVSASNACGTGTKTYNAVLGCREGNIAAANELNVYPNPTAGMLNVEYTSVKGTTHINLFDLSGRVVMSQSYNDITGINTQQLDLSKVAKGAYMLNVQTISGNNQVRVVVE